MFPAFKPLPSIAPYSSPATDAHRILSDAWQKLWAASVKMHSQHFYEIRPRKDHRGVDLISDALPFGRLWYAEPNAVSNAVGYAKFFSRSHDAVIRVYAPEGSRTVGVSEAGIALGKRIVSRCPEATDWSGRF
jgi:hypothetical protein